MALFDDIDIFSSGKEGKKVFTLPNTELILIDKFFSKEESDLYYKILLHTTSWQEYKMDIYDKTHTVPRMIAWYEERIIQVPALTGRDGLLNCWP